MTAVLAERFLNGRIVLASDHRQAELGLDDARDLFPASALPGEVGRLPVRPDDRVDPVLMKTPVLLMPDGKRRGIGQTEFLFVELAMPGEQLGRFRTVGRIDMNVMDRPARPSVRGDRFELAHRGERIVGDETPIRKNRHVLAGLATEQVPDQGGAAGTSSSAGQHHAPSGLHRPGSAGSTEDRRARALLQREVRPPRFPGKPPGAEPRPRSVWRPKPSVC